MRFLSCLSLLLFPALFFLLPILFYEFMTQSLEKLHLSPQAAALAGLSIFLGGLINIPVQRVSSGEAYLHDPLAVYGLGGLVPTLQRRTAESVIAVNLGGCVIPALLALYEIFHVVQRGTWMVTALVIAVLINVVACYLMARPIPGVGIVMPALVPGLVAATSALILAPEYAPPVAFVAGVLGPLVGADLLHIDDLRRHSPGIMSIGGAGTFDGIVFSGIVAAYLA